MNWRRLLFLTMAMLWAIPNIALAADTIVSSGETSKSMTVFGDDNLVVEGGATVDGHVTVWGGAAVINGTIDGNLFVYGGDVAISDEATITGDCVAVSGTITGECLAIGDGSGTDLSGDVAAGLPGFNNTTFHPWTLFAVIATLLTLAAFGTARSAPVPLHRLEDVIRTEPIASGLFGALTLVAGGIVVALVIALSTALVGFVIGALGYPIALALLGLLVVAGLFGWLAVGGIVGEWLSTQFNIGSEPLAATLGTLALLTIIGIALAIGTIPALVVAGMIVSIGMGAATLTRLGTRERPYRH